MIGGIGDILSPAPRREDIFGQYCSLQALLSFTRQEYSIKGMYFQLLCGTNNIYL